MEAGLSLESKKTRTKRKRNKNLSHFDESLILVRTDYRRAYRGLSLVEVTIAVILLPLVSFAALRLYIDVMRRQNPTRWAQQADTLLRSVHEEETPQLFSSSLNEKQTLTRKLQGKDFEVEFVLEEYQSYSPDELRMARYQVHYDVSGDPKTRRWSVLAQKVD